MLDGLLWFLVLEFGTGALNTDSFELRTVGVVDSEVFILHRDLSVPIEAECPMHAWLHLARCGGRVGVSVSS